MTRGLHRVPGFQRGRDRGAGSKPASQRGRQQRARRRTSSELERHERAGRRSHVAPSAIHSYPHLNPHQIARRQTNPVVCPPSAVAFLHQPLDPANPLSGESAEEASSRAAKKVAQSHGSGLGDGIDELSTSVDIVC
jgi:hypothetical protein